MVAIVFMVAAVDGCQPISPVKYSSRVDYPLLAVGLNLARRGVDILARVRLQAASGRLLVAIEAGTGLLRG